MQSGATSTSRDLPPATRRLIVLGAGPVGIEAALHAALRGWDVRVLEAGRAAEHLLAWGHIRMFSPWEMNCSTAGLEVLEAEGERPFDDPHHCPTGRQWARDYVLPLSRTPFLRGRIVTGCRVIGVSRDRTLKGDLIGDPARALRPFRILARRNERDVIFESDVVIDTTGTFGQPRRMGNGGLPAPGELQAGERIEYRPVDFPSRGGEFVGRRVLLVGGGHSAMTAAVALRDIAASDPDTRVFWAVRAERQPWFKRVPDDPLPERGRLVVEAATIAAGAAPGFTFIPAASVEAIAATTKKTPLRVTLRTPEGRRTVVADRILAHVGFAPDRGLYAELQVHECYASAGPMKLAAALLGAGGGDCLSQPAVGPDVLTNPEPGFFILGAKSYGRNPNFLFRTGVAQITTLLPALGPSRLVA
jgi:cation diffusion facilitator CzcD-associated flavoprotein CzcO